MQRVAVIGGGLVGLGLLVSFVLVGAWWAAGLAALSGGLWLAGPWLQRNWLRDWLFVLWALLAAYGVLMQVSPIVLLTLMVVALAAWDLARFRHRLDGVADVRDGSALAAAHLRRLGLALGGGWILGALTLSFSFRVNLLAAILLGTFLVWGLSRVVRFLLGANQSQS